VADRLFAECCHRGVRTQYIVVPLTEHVLTGDAGAAGAVSWLAARFAGLPAPSNR
jgi:hypothetical protein